jgi:hypothetical protein
MEQERKIPGVLWISIATYSVITLIQLFIGLQKSSGVLLLSVVVGVALITGLILGHKWAYILTLLFATSGLVVSLGQGPENFIGVLIGNGLVVVPMLLATSYFFPGKQGRPDAGMVR